MGYYDSTVQARHGWLDAWKDMADLAFFQAVPGLLSTAWAAAMVNDAFVSRVWNPRRFRSSHAYVLNGSAVSGNFDIGVYTPDLVKIGSTGSTAQSGTSTAQFVTLDAEIPAGELLLALAFDNSTGAITHPNISLSLFPLGGLETMGWAMAEVVMPLPDPLTGMTAPAASVIPPLFGIVDRWP